MKKTPQMQKLEELLRSGRIVVGGFMAGDKRSLVEIIEADLMKVERHGKTLSQIAEKMKQITETAKTGLGQPVKIGDNLYATVDDFRGKITCPWPHPGTYHKRITTIENTDTGKKLLWTDLNIHMIETHGFFEGRGAMFRTEPNELIEMIF